MPGGAGVVVVLLTNYSSVSVWVCRCARGRVCGPAWCLHHRGEPWNTTKGTCDFMGDYDIIL